MATRDHSRSPRRGPEPKRSGAPIVLLVALLVAGIAGGMFLLQASEGQHENMPGQRPAADSGAERPATATPAASGGLSRDALIAAETKQRLADFVGHNARAGVQLSDEDNQKIAANIRATIDLKFDVLDRAAAIGRRVREREEHKRGGDFAEPMRRIDRIVADRIEGLERKGGATFLESATDPILEQLYDREVFVYDETQRAQQVFDRESKAAR